MVSDGGAKRNWMLYTAIGLIFLAGSLALFSVTWVYVSPREPDVVGQEPPKGPEANYQPGGAGCEPSKLAALRTKGAQRERDRCAQAREEHRIEQENLNQQIRSVDLSERNLRLSEGQARSAVVTTLATVAAFLAAALAAIAAFFAVYYAKKSADADNANLIATQDGMEAARRDAVKHDKRFTDQLALSQETMEYTARTARAMESSSTAMRRTAMAAAKAAESSNLSYEIARAIELPTLVLSKISLGDRLPKLADELRRSVVELQVRNYGRSPAFLIEQASEISLDPLPDTPVYNRTFPMDADKVAMPDKDHDLYVAAKRGGISAEEAEDIISGARILSVYGFVKYRDFLGNYTTMRFLKVARIVTLPRLRSDKMNALLPWPDNTIIIFNDDTDERRKKYSETTHHNATSDPKPLGG